MTQTRGRATKALLHGGGVVRQIDRESVCRMLQRNDLPQDEQTVERIWQRLRTRIVDIDAPPKTVRGNERQIVRIEKAAAELMEAMKGYPDFSDLKLSIIGDLAQIGYSDHGGSLYRWLLRLSVARERYFHPYQPSGSYHEAIAFMREAIQDAGGEVTIHERSKFVLFLIGLEEFWPCLIFPSGTVSTGRVRYVERALENRPPPRIKARTLRNSGNMRKRQRVNIGKPNLFER